MPQNQRQRVRDVEELNVNAVQLGGELGRRVEPRLQAPPVVLARPVLAYALMEAMRQLNTPYG
jgi:hypothetical protein